MSEHDELPTNEQIADLILAQTYEERVDLAGYLGDCAKSWMESGGVSADLDASYFAALLAGWAEQYQKNGASS